jgi:lysosomal acid lipase/cholesteryl ester hydrolase
MITQKETISYIGFSQGSTVGFATLALSKLINSKVNVMIALAATTKPKGTV